MTGRSLASMSRLDLGACCSALSRQLANLPRGASLHTMERSTHVDLTVSLAGRSLPTTNRVRRVRGSLPGKDRVSEQGIRFSWRDADDRMQQDQQLIEGVLRGDRAAFEAVVVTHQTAVYAYLRARLLQHSDAEDLTQEVFLRFYVARARFDNSQLIRPWLLGIARNLLRERARTVRRRRKEKEHAWTSLCLELEDLLRTERQNRQAEQIEDGHDLLMTHLPGCLDGLGQSARQAIQLHYTDNLRFADIGQKLKRSEGAVKILVFRARQALKRCLTQSLGTGGIPHDA